MIELNRPQMYMAGLIILLLGIHFRIVESVVLNEPTTRFIVEKFESREYASNTPSWLLVNAPASKKTVTPPKWLGWSFLSVGGVLVLHSLIMRK
jgi:hypothetical protein